jgi:hypothetical protein
MIYMIDQAMKKEAIEKIFSKNISLIDNILSDIKNIYPEFNTDNLCMTLTEMAKKHSEDAIKELYGFSQKMALTVQAELINFKTKSTTEGATNGNN